MNWAKITLQTGRSHAQLIHIGLADDDRACLFQFLDNNSVGCRNPLLERFEPGCCFNPRCVIKVFDTDWYAVQRPTPITCPASSVWFRSSLTIVARHFRLLSDWQQRLLLREYSTGFSAPCFGTAAT